MLYVFKKSPVIKICIVVYSIAWAEVGFVSIFYLHHFDSYSF